MRARYCAAGLLLTFACANAEERYPSQTVAIVFRFDQPYAEHALKETERELEALIGSETIKLEWHDRNDFEGKSTFSSIVVLNFQGNCDPRSESLFNGPMNSWLARMHLFEGTVLPFGDVNCDLVRALMREGHHSAKLTDKAFGRALARVLAHELFHFLTQSTEHATQGLEKRSFSREDLVLDGLRLNGKGLARVLYAPDGK